MKKLIKILCVAMAGVLMLGGCAAPRLTLGGTPRDAATIDGTTVSTGEYLAYLYNTFYNMYYMQGLYQYEAYGYDVWSQTYTYGEGDDAKKVDFGEYVKLVAQDSMVRQFALRRLMEQYHVEWDAEKLKTLEEDLKDVGDNAYISLGISNENFIKVYKEINLNESSLFYTLYGKDGQKEISDADLRAYFDKNYVSYKIISEAMTDEKGSDLDEAGQKKITDKLEKYLTQYNASKNFETVYDTYRKDNAEEDEKIEPSKAEDTRIDVDATGADEKLMEAVRSVDVGSAKVVTYKANGSTPTAALIVRLDPNDPTSLFTDETDQIIYSLKYEEFDEEVKAAIAKLDVKLNKSAVKKCNPKNFVAG